MSDSQDASALPSRGFAKLDSGIVDSSLWMLDHDALRVWVYLLAKVDALGILRASVPAMAHACRLSLERFEEIMQGFEAPDAYSRSSENEGRRAQRIEGGWVLLNYLRYRELSQRKAGSHAERQARYYQRKKEQDELTGRTVTPDASPVTPDDLASPVTQKQRQTQTERQRTDVEAEVEKHLPEGKTSGALARTEFDELWTVCTKKVSKGKARSAYLKYRASGIMPDLTTVKASLIRLQSTRDWADDNRKHQPYLATWLNREGWEDELPANRASSSSSVVKVGAFDDDTREALRRIGTRAS